MTNNSNIVIKSPAKINLGLGIIGKRDDGFHDIETIFQKVSIFDRLIFKPRHSGIFFETNQKNLPSDETNLVVRAAKLLQKETGTKKGAEMFLEKNIPISAGLGGGSSNAASTLMGLNRLWELNLKVNYLIKLAIRLGSDVPFFLSEPTALGTGRGEILTPIENNMKIFLLVIFPNISISASSAYKGLSLGLTSKPKDISILRSLLAKGNIADLGANLYNDLENVVCKRYPILVEIKKKLIDSGAVGALVSGSGSSVFGLFSHSEAAGKAAAKLEKNDWQFFLAETINQP